YHSDNRSIENIFSVQRSTLIYAPTPRFTEKEPVVQQTNNEKIPQLFLFQDIQILNLASIERTIDNNALATDNQQLSGFGIQKPFK
ncbi:18643_t:CDS:2, partial [Gigaspora rosea]